jgi:H+/Cl- antiporter ClcA
MCAGISAGVSAAFASPIGGALFSYEMSKPNTFWTFAMLWRTFFCSSISTFTLSILNQLVAGEELEVNAAGTVKFGKLADVAVPLTQVLGALVLGVMGGVLGTFFITVNGFMGKQRKRFVNTNWKKIIECGCFGVATISTMTLLVTLFGECREIEEKPSIINDPTNYVKDLVLFN